MACTPSRQVIFLPASRLRARYVIGTSNGRMRRASSFPVISASMPNPSELMFKLRSRSRGMSLKHVSRSAMYALNSTFANVVRALLPWTYQNEYAEWLPKVRLP